MSGEVGAQSDSAPLYPVAMDLLLSLAIMGRGGEEEEEEVLGRGDVCCVAA